MSLSQTSGLTVEAMDRLKAEYMRLQLEKAQLAQQQQTAYNAHQAHINAHQQAAQHTYINNPYAQQIPVPIVPQHNLNEGAWDVPISQLVDLWVVKYGTKWVNHNELDEFYEVASRRLKALNKLEQHYVNGTDVYKIVE